jgi:alanine dehydrogenase
MLLLTETDVERMVSIENALSAVEVSFSEQADGTGINLPRQRLRQPAGTMHLMGAALTQRGYWGFKAYTTTQAGAKFSINLYSLEYGALLAVIEANLLGQLRTGAASGIATKYLARHDSTTMAVFGSGFQARTQILAIMAVHPLRQIKVFSPNKVHRDDFAREISGLIPAEVVTVSSPDEALDQADIITTITTSKLPVFPGSLLQPGTHINAAGSNSLLRTELDSDAIRRINLFFTDDIDQARIESGNLIQANEKNLFNWSKLVRLADVVGQYHPGRQWEDEITLFESHGIALWDIALAAEVYERAVKEGVGKEIDFLT